MGKLNYKPNTFGILSYLTEVHPIVKKHIPQCKTVYRRDGLPPLVKKAISSGSLYSIFSVSWKMCVLYICSADICIAPLQSGSGTRLKILEYMASGKPVVSTSIGSEGLNATDNKNIIIEDDWELFAHKNN